MTQTKKEARTEIAAALEKMTPAERKQEEELLIAALTASREWQEAETIGAFLPLSDEFDTRPLLHRALKEGKKIALPRLTAGTRQMNFHLVDSLEGPFEKHRYGMDEPLASAPIWRPKLHPTGEGKKRNLMVIPGLAFTIDGWRLGRGAGYYDTYLNREAACLTMVALPYRCQITESLPCEAHDHRVDRVFLI